MRGVFPVSRCRTTRTICHSVIPANRGTVSGSIRPNSSVCCRVSWNTALAAPLQGFAAGKGVVGGSLPAKIWKDFMEQASAPTVAGNNPVTLPASPTTVGQSQEAPGLSDQNAAAPAAEAQNPQCNVPACEEFYHSFRVSDCTYQPYWGPREYCER
jgi:membrane peptidoglycan carboxypeptidase